MEIIEIGAVLVERIGERFETIREFQCFVRPVRTPALTRFCTTLTNISQADVDEAPYFRDAVEVFKRWLYSDPRDVLFCSWGDYDRNQLRQDCDFHRLPFPISRPHINVKKELTRVQGLAKRPGLGRAVALAGLEFDGTPHRAIDDARNIARLLPFIFGSRSMPNHGTKS